MGINGMSWEVVMLFMETLVFSYIKYNFRNWKIYARTLKINGIPVNFHFSKDILYISKDNLAF